MVKGKFLDELLFLSHWTYLLRAGYYLRNMKYYKKILTGMLFGILAACGGVEGEDPLLEELPAGSAVTGATVYATNCLSCHGATQTGITGPDITTATENKIRIAVRNGVSNKMSSFSKTQITSQQLADLIAYLLTTN
jgi:mono/diheme cytochrome c family protein